MVSRKVIIDGDGQPVDQGALSAEDGAPTIMGIRQVRQDHPSYGITPNGLALILRNAEQTDPSRFFSLCADIEAREPHFRSVLSTRKTQVSQVPITVIAADVPDGELHAQVVRDFVEAPEFPLQLVDMLDALGKGISWSEKVWDFSSGQAVIQKIEWRDPRWFRFDIADLTTGMLLDESGMPQPLKLHKWIVHRPKLLSGIPVLNGLTRCAAFGWMFKNFALKDWAIFLDVYGHPLRLGRFPENATAAERRQLLEAVSNLGSDAAAIIPAAMTIEFAQGGATTSSSGSPYKEMATYFDEQHSKLVLGQTGTTDAVAGGSRGLGQVQDGVRGDIERSDCVQLGATLNRDVVPDLVAFNFGPQKKYPRAVMGRPEQKDIEALTNAVQVLVPLGMPVGKKQMRDLVGIGEPEPGDELLTAPAPQPAILPPGGNAGGTPPLDPRAGTSSGGGADGVPNPANEDGPDADPDKPATILAASEALARMGGPDWADRAVDAVIKANGWQPDVESLREKIAKVKTEEEFAQVLASALGEMGLDTFAELLAKLNFNARGHGVTDQ